MKRKFLSCFTSLALLLFAFATAASAQTIRYVKEGGTGTGVSSWGNASGDLQKMINASAPGDQVWVAGGTYKPIYRPDEEVNTNTPEEADKAFYLKKDVSIYGSFAGSELSLASRTAAVMAANPSILDGLLSGDNGPYHVYHVVIIAGDLGTIQFNGFTIINGQATPIEHVYPSYIGVNGTAISKNGGGGICLQQDNQNIPNSIILKNLIIKNNSGIYGAGMDIERSKATITDVTVINNKAEPTGHYGSIFMFASSPVFNRVIIANNAANGIYNTYSNPVLNNVIFYGNRACLFNSASSPILTNVTMYGNSDRQMYNQMDYDGPVPTDPSHPQIRNSILMGAPMASPDGDLSSPIISYSVLQDYLYVPEPLFVDPANHDFHLQDGSPLINMGNNDYFTSGQTPDLTGVTTDADGYNRIRGGIVDIGAYENRNQFKPDDNHILYVKKGVDGDGNSWENPIGELGDALNAATVLNAANPGAVNQIWVAGGTYAPLYKVSASTDDNGDQSFVLVKDVKIYGGFAGNEHLLKDRKLELLENTSVLTGDLSINNNSGYAYHVVLSAGDVGTAELNGFTIQSGNAVGDGFIHVNTQDVYRFSGGGICSIGSSPDLTNLVIADNSGNYGAGVYNLFSSAVLTNVLIRNNGGFTQGGGMYNRSSSPVLTNVVVSNNIAGTASGIYNNNATPVLHNSIVFGNNNDGMISEIGSVPVVTYSLVQGLSADLTNHNFDGNTDPLFEDAPNKDYHLKSGSLLINAGNNSYFSGGQTPDLSSISTDIEGHSRISESAIDLGVYEVQSPLPVNLISFTAKAENSTVRLQWATATETNNKAFVISRSADGQTFTEIGEVAGAGNSSLQKNYIFYDKNPLNALNYYRLQQVDFDGRITSHGIRKVEFSLPGLIKLYPDPVTDLLTIEFPAENYQRLELVDNNGRVLLTLHVSIGENHKTLHLKNYSSGAYYIRFSGNEKTIVRKIVKD